MTKKLSKRQTRLRAFRDRFTILGKPLRRGTQSHTYQHAHNEYCDKFDDACRERIRHKYGNECYYCGRTEIENGTRLSVHHLDMNKDQGCNGHEWKLIPLCKSCHGKAHTDTMTAKLMAMYATDRRLTS